MLLEVLFPTHDEYTQEKLDHEFISSQLRIEMC
jgi:hypothetical protein